MHSLVSRFIFRLRQGGHQTRRPRANPAPRWRPGSPPCSLHFRQQVGAPSCPSFQNILPETRPRGTGHRSVPRPRAETTVPPGGYRPPCHLDQRGRRKRPRISVVSEGPWRPDPQDPALPRPKLSCPRDLPPASLLLVRALNAQRPRRGRAPSSGKREFWKHRSNVPS